MNEFHGGPLDGERAELDVPVGAIWKIPLPNPPATATAPTEIDPNPTWRVGHYRIVARGRAEWEGEPGPALPTKPPPRLGKRFENKPLDFGPDLWDLLEDWRG